MPDHRVRKMSTMRASLSAGTEPNESSPPNFTFDVFISYRRSDGTKAARRLRQKLQRYDIHKRLKHLPRRKLKVFLDTVYERGADDFYERNIRPALLSSRYLIVLATPDATLKPDGDDWIQREIQDFRAHRGAESILVVRAAGDFLAQLPGDLDDTAPNIQIIDLRRAGFFSTVSPLHSSRLADEWIKLVAPLFDVPVADMPKLRREQELAQQRVLAVATGGIAGAIVFATTLSWYALTQQRASQQTLDNSLFAASRIIERASSLNLGTEHENERRSMLMMACDLFDNMADPSARAKFELDILNCDIDRISSLIELGDLERARANLRAIEPQVQSQYSKTKTAAWAEAVSSMLNLAIRIELLSAKDDAGQIRVVRDNARDQSELFKQHLTFSLAVDYSSRVEQLTRALENAGDFKESAQVIETAAALFEAMAQKKMDTVNETDEIVERRKNYGLSQAATLQRRLGWLRTEKLKDAPGALAATAAALALVKTGLSLTTPGTAQYISLRRDEMFAEEVRGTALLKSRQLAEGVAADRRGLAVADELLALNISDRQRDELEKERNFLVQRIAKVEAAPALTSP